WTRAGRTAPGERGRHPACLSIRLDDASTGILRASTRLLPSPAFSLTVALAVSRMPSSSPDVRGLSHGGQESAANRSPTTLYSLPGRLQPRSDLSGLPHLRGR